MNDTYYRQIIERVNFLNPNNSQLINTALFLDKFGPIYQPHQYKNLGGEFKNYTKCTMMPGVYSDYKGNLRK